MSIFYLIINYFIQYFFKMSIDTLNWKILKYLQQNARLSNAEIGRQVGISSPAVSERIKKMEDLGVIEGYNTFVSSLEAGYQLKAIKALFITTLTYLKVNFKQILL